MMWQYQFRSRVRPSPTPDDSPPPSPDQRRSASPAQQGPDDLGSRPRPGTPDAPHPRKGRGSLLGQRIQHVSQVLAGAVPGLPQWTAMAGPAPSPPGAEDHPVAPERAAPADLSAILNQDGQRGRSPTIAAHRRSGLPASVLNSARRGSPRPARDEAHAPPARPLAAGQVEQPLLPCTPEPPLQAICPSPPQERPGRPSRHDAVAATLRQVARQMHLPQTAQALADASLTRAISATADTLVGRPLRGAKQVASILGEAADNWWNKPRLSSAHLQLALLGEGVDLSHPAAQARAHAHAVDYGASAATVLDTALPVLHQVTKIGVAGTAMAFGLGRNAGMAAGDAIGRVICEAPPAAGWRAGPELPAAAMSSSRAFKLAGTGLLQWGLGSLTGAAGHMAGQYLAAPLMNLIPRQFLPIDPRAVLPDEMVALMNRLQDGAGDALRRQVQEAQSDIVRIESPSNVLLGQLAFDALTAARFATQGGLPLGAAGQVGAGLAVSACAGMTIGVAMATRQSVAAQQIPDADALRLAVDAHEARPGSDGTAVLAAVPRHAVPLFFPTHIAPAARPNPPGDLEAGEPARNADAAERHRLAGMLTTAKRAVQTVASPVGQAWSRSLASSPLIEPAAPGTAGGITAARVGNTLSNVTASIWNRTTEMAKSTRTTSLISTLSAMAATTTEGPARRVILAVGHTIGIHAAIKPWFDALAVTIPHGDTGVRDHRQEVANRRAGM